MAVNMAPQGPLPMPVQQAATAYRLGPFMKVYKANLIRYIGGAIVGIIIFVLFLFIALQNTSDALALLGNFLIALIGLGLLIAMIYLFSRTGSQQVFLFQQGFIVENKGQVQVFPWNQTAEVLQDITRHYRNGIYTGTTYKYTLRRTDGYQIRLNNMTKGIAELGQAISVGITRELVPRALNSIRSGQTLTFAQFTINQQGMGNGHDFIPWQQVEAVNVNRGRISIKKSGKFLSWGTTMVSRIPNFFVFTAVADEMIRQFGGIRY